MCAIQITDQIRLREHLMLREVVDCNVGLLEDEVDTVSRLMLTCTSQRRSVESKTMWKRRRTSPSQTICGVCFMSYNTLCDSPKMCAACNYHLCNSLYSTCHLRELAYNETEQCHQTNDTHQWTRALDTFVKRVSRRVLSLSMCCWQSTSVESAICRHS